MRNMITNKGVDLLLELLRQSRSIKTRIDKSDNNKALQSEEIEYNRNRKVSLKGPDTDGKLMLSRKGKDINQRKRDEYFQQIKKHIEGILNRLTEEDYKMLAQEGFQVEDLTIESLASAIQTIKRYNAGKELGLERYLPKKEDKNMSDEKLKGRMKALNLPVTKESIERIKGALKLSECIPYIEKKDALFLLKKELQPTIENLYKARYSNQHKETIKRLSDEDWKELIPQVREIIDKAQVTNDKDILEDAKWLIENNLPLTKSNLNFLSGLKDLVRTYDQDKVLDRILEGMKDGTLPGDVNLLEKDQLLTQNHNILPADEEKIKKLMENIHRNYDDEIVRAIKANQELTIENLANLQKEASIDEEQAIDELTNEQLAKAISAKRQLEEIRLKMTAEAALRLERKGFNIDTRPLKEVVDKLRHEEESYYKELYHQAGIEPDEENLEILRATTESVDELKLMPSYILGTTLYEKRLQSITGLLNEGRYMLAELEKAKEAYEPLLTQPRADYGDSIQKAFNNMSSLMEEMGIEDTVYNRRAIKILAYNRMEITKDAIEQVKSYDLKVNYLIQNLNPKVALHIIKEGINPMDISIEELNKRLEKMNHELGYPSLEKYSSYLYRLEKEAQISESEKKAYIGIYRLLYQIEKSDGAALGALIKSEREVTLNHLLSALRTIRKGGMDYKINDSFGILQDISYEKETITDQLGALYNNDKNSFSAQQNIQEDVQKSIVKQLLDTLTPEKLHHLHQDLKAESSTISDVWDTLGNMPIEKLFDQLRSITTTSEADDGYYYEKLKELRDIYSNCDNAIRFLGDFKIPCTTTNLIMAGHILNNDGLLFKKLIKSEKHLKKKSELSDKLIDKKTMNEAYDELEQEVNDIIDQESKEENIDSIKLNQLKSMGLQMQFLKTLAKREFYRIPIEVSGRITNINLTIVRGKPGKGKVTVTLVSDRLGSIKAEASVNEKKLSGYFACEYADSLSLLQSQTDELKSLLKEDSLEIKQLNFCLQEAADLIHGFQNSWDSEEKSNPETELTLYRVAKSIISMIKSAEEVKFSHTEVAEVI